MLKDSIQITLGIILVLIGLIGGLIPIFQGWIFGIPGIIILAKYSSSIKKIIVFLSQRFKIFKKILDKIEKTKNEQ